MSLSWKVENRCVLEKVVVLKRKATKAYLLLTI